MHTHSESYIVHKINYLLQKELKKNNEKKSGQATQNKQTNALHQAMMFVQPILNLDRKRESNLVRKILLFEPALAFVCWLCLADIYVCMFPDFR